MRRILLCIASALVCIPTLAAEDANFYNNQGISLGQKGEFDKAIEDFDQALRLDPNFTQAYYNRGKVWGLKGEFDKDIADCDQALRLDPNFTLAYYNRGKAWGLKGEFDKAIADFDQALRLDPNYAPAFNNRGLCWKGKDQFDKAIADFDQALRLDPNFALAFNNRGLSWQGKGEFDKAIADYKQALRLDPNYAIAYNNLAWLQATCPNLRYIDGKAALINANKAYQLSDGKDWHYLSTLAAVYAENGDFEKALEWQVKAIEMAAKDKNMMEDNMQELRSHLELFKKNKPYRQESIKHQPNEPQNRKTNRRSAPALLA
jgi:tetratricopeptide (TPR) repeat protein